jgi:hypothetical protein
MFEQTFVPEGRTRKPWTVVAAFLVQLVAVGIILAIPLIFVRTLPIPELTSMLVAPPPVVRIDRPTSAHFESRFAAASCSGRRNWSYDYPPISTQANLKNWVEETG